MMRELHCIGESIRRSDSHSRGAVSVHSVPWRDLSVRFSLWNSGIVILPALLGYGRIKIKAMLMKSAIYVYSV